MQLNSNINTHNIYKSFIDANFTEKQSEAVVDVFEKMQKHNKNELTIETESKVEKSETRTKYDIMLLQKDIKELDVKLETKIKELDIKLEARLKELELKFNSSLKDNLLKMYFALGALGTILLTAMLGLLPYILKHY